MSPTYGLVPVSQLAAENRAQAHIHRARNHVLNVRSCLHLGMDEKVARDCEPLADLICSLEATLQYAKAYRDGVTQ